MSIIATKKQVTINSIKNFKNNQVITMITAYDALFANLFDDMVDIILVGDSLHMSFGGAKDTLSITLDEMIYHAKAVCRGVKSSCVVLDMPFGAYTNKKEALKNAIKVYQKTEVHAIKIEGGEDKAHIVEHLTKNGIAVVGHIGLLPQSVRGEGGYRVKGRTKEEVKELLKDAKAIENAGAFCMVVEGVVSEVATQIAQSVSIPVVGIGAGNGVDGQVLVWSDALGFFESFKPKFAKRYMEGATLVRNALKEYVKEVHSREFPNKEHSY